MQKNADALDASCTKALAASSDPFIRRLIASAAGGASAAAGAGADAGRMAGPRSSLGGRGGNLSGSLGRAFVAELDSLLVTLNSGGCHFVRCVAPSGSGGKPGASLRAFDASAVLGQLRADGTLDAVRLLQKGYPVRIPYEQLQRRFLPLLAPVSPKMSALSAEQFAELLAVVVGVPGADCALGSTRIFLRGSAAILFDELGQMEPARVLPILTRLLAEWEAKKAALQRLAPILIGWGARFRFKRCRRAAIRIQARHRGGVGRGRAQVRSRERQAEILAQRRAATTAPAARAAAAARPERPSFAVGSEEVRATLAQRDFSMLENEMRVVVARARADEAATELAQTPRGAQQSGAPTEYIPRQQALLRAPQFASAAADGSLELLVLEEGTSLPVYRTLIHRNELIRLRGIFDEWDLDHVRTAATDLARAARPRIRPSACPRMLTASLAPARPFAARALSSPAPACTQDGVVSLGEFFVVMKVLSSKASRGRTMEAAQIEGMFEVADVDRNGFISFAEFALFSYGELTRTEGAKHSTLMLHTKAASKLINRRMSETPPVSKRTPLAAMLPAIPKSRSGSLAASSRPSPLMPARSHAASARSEPMRAINRLNLTDLGRVGGGGARPLMPVSSRNQPTQPNPARPPAQPDPARPPQPSLRVSTGSSDADLDGMQQSRRRSPSISNIAAGMRSASGKALSGLVRRMSFGRKKDASGRVSSSSRTSEATTSQSSPPPASLPPRLHSTTTMDSDYEA